jgi:hypothetical protein
MSHTEFLVAFTKWQKVTINFAMLVCQSAWNNQAPNGQIFMKFDI